VGQTDRPRDRSTACTSINVYYPAAGSNRGRAVNTNPCDK